MGELRKELRLTESIGKGDDFEALLKAVRHARWYLHCEMLRDREDDLEGPEIAMETAIGLARAVLPFDPDTPACEGCASGKSPWAWSARDLLTDYEQKTGRSA